MLLGHDSKGNELKVGDICRFNLIGSDSTLEGMIVYDEEYFAYAFEMPDDRFPLINMYNCRNIEKIISVLSTKKDDSFQFYRDIFFK